MLKSINGLGILVRNILQYFQFSILLFALMALFQSCGGLKKNRLNRTLDRTFEASQFSNHHSGFLVIDPMKNDTLYKKFASRYFIPASNVKIFTLYTALKLIPEQVPSIRYLVSNDTLYFEGLGDPSALHPVFNDSTLLNFVSDYPASVLVESNFMEDVWPDGWSWEDYDLHYAPERSSLPLYGNVVQFYQNTSARVVPEYFKDSVGTLDAPFKRAPDMNQFYVSKDAPDSLEIPMKLRTGLQKELLEAALDRKIMNRGSFPAGRMKILYGISRDTLLKEMMVESDNFLAEQLLLMASSTLSDTLSSSAVISHMKEKELSFLKNSPRWVDGSGLSRYNLFTPESIVQVLELLYSEYGADGILEYFPRGGESGTLRNDYRKSEEPYLFAKSGSMGNIYCISGYLKTKSGKTLIFSFMNNNFRIGQSELRKEISSILERMHEDY